MNAKRREIASSATTETHIVKNTAVHRLTETVGRRTFLKVLGSAGPAAAISACSPVPPEKVIPYVVPPE